MAISSTSANAHTIITRESGGIEPVPAHSSSDFPVALARHCGWPRALDHLDVLAEQEAGPTDPRSPVPSGDPRSDASQDLGKQTFDSCEYLGVVDGLTVKSGPVPFLELEVPLPPFLALAKAGRAERGTVQVAMPVRRTLALNSHRVQAVTRQHGRIRRRARAGRQCLARRAAHRRWGRSPGPSAREPCRGRWWSSPRPGRGCWR